MKDTSKKRIKEVLKSGFDPFSSTLENQIKFIELLKAIQPMPIIGGVLDSLKELRGIKQSRVEDFKKSFPPKTRF